MKKEGVFAESQTITLGKIEKSITFDVESIHLFLKLLDSKTNDPISNLQISRDGREIGEPVSMGRVKLIFPKTGDYTLKIIDPNKEYLEKTFSLNISQRTIGKEYKVEIDLKTGISFSIVDKTTGIALKGVHVFRDKKEVGKTNSLGHYAEDFDPDPRKYFDYSFKSDHYMSVDNKKIYRNPGRQTDNVELTKLTSNILLIDGKGNFAPYVDVLISNKKVGETDGAGEYEFSPKSIGETFSMKFVSPGELYIPTKRTFKFVRNEQQESIAISRQPWIELKLIEPGGFTLPNVKVISSTGQTGHSDTLGIFRYKVLDKFENVVFSFTQPGFEKISKEISSVDLVTKEDIVIPRLQAYFYVYDSRTNQPVKDLQISVNGYPQTRTDFNGKANIFPNEKPSDLDIYIDAPDDSYIPVSNKVKYTENKLGKFLIDPRPIDINVFVRWSTGSPIKGSIEIDIPYEKYILKQEDRGRHTFQSYNRLIKPTLTITTQTPTGQPLINDFPITIPNQGIFSVDVPIVISKMPTINILVDEGVKLKIIQRTISGDSSIFISDHDGNYKGELPDFGGYTIIRSGSGFRKPDSKFFIIEKVEQTLNLRVKPNCQDAKAFFENRNWTNFIKKVDQLTQNDECYCEMNKKAGEVSMEHLNAYANALEYYNNIIYKSCVIDDINPEIDPYIHLRMLECSVESKQYNEGIREAEKFDGLVHLLKQNNKAQSICNKNYLLGLLMIEEYWRLCDEKSRASYNVANKIKKEVDELGKKIKDHLEMYEKTRGSCSSLQVQLNQIGGGCK